MPKYHPGTKPRVPALFPDMITSIYCYKKVNNPYDRLTLTLFETMSSMTQKNYRKKAENWPNMHWNQILPSKKSFEE